MHINGDKVNSINASDVDANGVITIPEGVKHLDRYSTIVFSDNVITSFKKLVLPSTLEYVPGYVFTGIKSLEEVVLPEGILNIAGNAFKNTSIKKITIPSTVKTVDGGAFADCKLEEVVLSEGVEVIGLSAFANNTNLKSIKFPSTIKNILPSAFQKCTSLETISFSEDTTLKHINLNSFANTSIKTFKLPSSVTSVNGAIGVEEGIVDIDYSNNNVLQSLMLRVTDASKKIIIPETVNECKIMNANSTDTLNIEYIHGGKAYEAEVVSNYWFTVKENEGLKYAGWFYNEKQYDKPELNKVSRKFSIMLPNGNVDYLNKEFFENVLGSSALIEKGMVGSYYLWLERLKQIYNTEDLKSLPNAYEVMHIPFDKIENFVANRKFFNQIYNSVFPETNNQNITSQQTVTASRYEKVLRFAVWLGMLEQDPGIKNKVITFLRTHVIYNRAGLNAFDRTAFPESVANTDNAFNSKRFNLIENIYNSKLNDDVKIRLCFIATEHFNEIIKIKKTPTLDDLTNYLTFNNYGKLEEHEVEIAKISALYNISVEDFKMIRSMHASSKKSSVQGLISFAKERALVVGKNQDVVNDNIVEELNGNFSFEWLEKGNANSAMLGYICNCCAKIGGQGYGVMQSSINPYYPVQNLVVRTKDGTIIGKVSAFLDFNEGLIMLSTLELNQNFLDKAKNDTRQEVFNTFKRGIKQMVVEYNKALDGNLPKLTRVQIGLKHSDLYNEIKENLKKVNDSDVYTNADFGGYGVDRREQYDFLSENEPTNTL